MVEWQTKNLWNKNQDKANVLREDESVNKAEVSMLWQAALHSYGVGRGEAPALACCSASLSVRSNRLSLLPYSTTHRHAHLQYWLCSQCQVYQ